MIPTSTVSGALLALLSIAACRAEPATPAATPAPPTASGAAPRNAAMGTGEGRIPERFTIEQRLLDAARRGDRPTIERALDRGATLQAKDEIGRCALFLAVMDAGDLELARWLRGRGAPLDEADVGGRTPLSFAAAAGRLDIVRYLAEEGARVDHGDVQQRTALFHAALGDHREVAAFLLARGAAVNVRDQFGDTPLIVACAKGQGEMALLLRAHGADSSLKDQEGRTASDRAIEGTEGCQEPASK